MWKVKCDKLCRQHLLGEHLEMHMFASCIKQKKCLKGYIDKNLVETHNIKKRHDELVKEMLRRGYKHYSPIKNFKTYKSGKVNIKKNEKELRRRCKECRKR
jgi:hypothetical protein